MTSTGRFGSAIRRTPIRAAVGAVVGDRRHRQLTTWYALGIILGCYVLFYGPGVYYAVTGVGAGGGFEDYSTPGMQAALIRVVGQVLVAVIVFGLVCRWLRIPRRLAGLPRRRREILSVADRSSPRRVAPYVWPGLLSLLVVVVGDVLSIVIDSVMSPAEPTASTNIEFASNSLSVIGAVVRALNAGIVEEITLVALPVLLGRRAGWHPGLIVVLSVGLRIPFHLYHGWTAIPWAMAWAGANIVAYLYLRRLLPLIVVHVAHDLFSFSGSSSSRWVVVVVILAGLLGYCWYAWFAHRSRYRSVMVGSDTIRYYRRGDGVVEVLDKARTARHSIWDVIDAVRAAVPQRTGYVRVARSRHHRHSAEMAAAGYQWSWRKPYRIPLRRRDVA